MTVAFQHWYKCGSDGFFIAVEYYRRHYDGTSLSPFIFVGKKIQH